MAGSKETVHQHRPETEELSANSHYVDLLQALKSFTGESTIRNISVPAAGGDISASQVFPQAHVFYSDIEQLVVSDLKRRGKHAVIGDINRHVPGVPVDLTVLFNTNGMEDIRSVVSSTGEGGYIIDSHWGGAAREAFFIDPHLEFVGVIKATDTEKGEVLSVKTDMYRSEYLNAEKDALGGIPKQEGDQAYIFKRRSNEEAAFVQGLPAWTKKWYVGKEPREINGTKYDTVVLDPAMEKRLPDFVMPPMNGIVYVSAQMPPEYRAFNTGHEFIEFTELAGNEDACRLATQWEIDHVPLKNRNDYIKRRIGFYEKLLVMYKDNQDDHAKRIRDTIPASISLLQSYMSVT